jgi:flagellar hook-length control protein FliK
MAALSLARRVQYGLHARLHDGLRHMELTAQWPAELVAVADPLARGAAPLLRPGELESESAAPPLPFELYLTLLTTPQPTGKPSPPTGNELPVLPPVAAPAASPVTSAGAPPPMDAALFARLQLASVPTSASTQPVTAPALPAPNADAAATGPTPSATAAPSSLPGATAEQLPPPHDSATAVPSPAAELVAPEIAEAAVPLAPADHLGRPGELERAATAADARTPRLPGVAAELESALPQQARSVLGAPDARLAETAARLREGAPSLEVTKLGQVSMSAVLEATKASTDWLPAGHGNGTSAATAAAAPAATVSAPLDLRTPNWQETFASRVQWLVGSNAGEARITLNPPELGAVDVKVSLVDDKTYVQLTTATTAARDELTQSLPRLRELFAASGLELGGASVHDGRGDHRAGHGGAAGAPEPRPIAPFVELADEPTLATQRRPLGRVDVFA